METNQETVAVPGKVGNGLNELTAALAKAQGRIEAAEKDRTNPHFGQRYATLAAVWEVIRKPLSENGLAVVQIPSIDTAKGEVTVTTRLLHVSGQEMECSVPMPCAQRSAQAYGSAITYARRYGLAAMVGVVADEDDDANQAVSGGQQRQNQAPPKPAQSRTEAVAAKVAAKASGAAPTPPPPAPAAPGELALAFGPHKGKPVAGLEASELRESIEAYETAIADKPKASWAGAARKQLDALKLEEKARLESAGAEPGAAS